MTLVMACVMFVAWMRGQIYADVITLPYNTSSVQIATGYFGIGVEYSVDEGPMQAFQWRVFPMPPLAEIQEGEQYNAAIFGPDEYWKWEYGGIRFTSLHQTRLAWVSHWFCIAPLTLLSAYLILWKPRKSVKREA